MSGHMSALRERYVALCAELPARPPSAPRPARPAPAPPRPERRHPDILGHVARIFAVERTALTGRSRSASVVAARHAAMLVLRERYGLSLAVIGALLGNRDHTTVRYGLEVAASRCRHDAAYAAQVAALREAGGAQ